MILVSGPVCAGKTTLATALESTGFFTTLRVRDILAALINEGAPSRAQLLERGAEIERATKGAWLVEAVLRALDSVPPAGNLVVDAVRTRAQFSRLAATLQDAVAIHMTATYEERLRRHDERRQRVGKIESVQFASIVSHQTEQGAEALRELANLVVDTTHLDQEAVASIARLFLKV